MEKIVLIMGGGSGIGKACADKFYGNDYEIVIAGRDKKKLEDICDFFSKAGGFPHLSSISVDIRSDKSLENMMKYLENEGKVIDILVNSCGINTPNRNFENMNYQATQDIIDTNLTGAINLTNKVIEHMKQYGGGTIIHIGSTAGIKTSVLSGVAYSASKHGLVSLVKSINLEEAKNNIRASLISPATVNTELLSSRKEAPSEEIREKLLQPEDIAEIVYFISQQPKNVLIEQVNLSSYLEADFL